MADDRVEFEKIRRADAARMELDGSLQNLADELFQRSDEHNYSYVWNWCGLPIIQLPADIVTMQEIIWSQRPTVILETGIARGGSLILYSSMLELIGSGRVIGVDIDIRQHNRKAIEEHPFSRRITMIEGSSIDDATVDQVRNEISDHDRVMVVLDSNHTHDHVLKELELYAPLVTEDQFLVVADTVIERIPAQQHRPRDWGPGNNPHTALEEFLSKDHRFERDDWFNQKVLFTNSPGGYLRRIKPSNR